MLDDLKEKWWWIWLLSALACGGDSGGRRGSYDVEYHCRQLRACFEDETGQTLDDEGNCGEVVRDEYNSSTSAQRVQKDEAFSTCNHLNGCTYVECLEEELDVEYEFQTAAPSVPGFPDGPNFNQCVQNLSPAQGEVTSSVGSIPYSKATVNFWVNSEGCLTEIDVKLGSADCGIEFQTDGLIDSQGRYLITEVRLEARGLCPGYSDTLPSNASYREFAREEPLGTITVVRDDVSWFECAPGELIIEPGVVLEGFLSDGPDVDLTNTEIRLQGIFDQTHWDPGEDCAVEYY